MLIADIEFGRDGARIVTWTRDNKTLIKETHKFKHYFYQEDEEGLYTTLYGDKVKKRYVRKFWEAKTIIKNSDKKIYEGDVSYLKRFMIDKGSKIDKQGIPRICFFDIETTGFSSETEKIVSIVTYDNHTKQYFDFVLENDDERDLLRRFAKHVRDMDYDILSGWNSDRFDLPFIYDRMEKAGLSFARLARTDRCQDPYHSHEGMVYPIGGRVHIDYLKAYKKMVIKEMDSYALDYVAKEELGVGKIDIEELPGKLYEEGRISELLRYNRRDVEIMAQLDEKLSIFEFLDKVSYLSSSFMGDTLYNSRVVDSYILKYTSRRGIVLPTRSFTNKRSGYQGAKVLDPQKGVHRNVGVFDLASLYPSIIISFNLSPETMHGDVGTQETKGLVPILLEDLFNLRRAYRDEGRDNEQKVVKTIMNSFYGVMALPTFRLYTPAMAAAITKHGREIIEHTKSVVEDAGYTVIYGDTDSVFVSGIPSNKHAKQLELDINSKYDDYAAGFDMDNHRLEIEFEAFSPVTLMVKKKRYAMRLDNGKNKIAGFQLKRSDTQPLARSLQETVINYILDGAKAPEVIEWYDSMKHSAMNGSFDIELGIPSKFVKDPEEYNDGYRIRGALYSNKHLNKNIGAGDKVIIYLVANVDGTLYPSTDAIALEYEEEIPDGIFIDRKKLWARVEKALLPLLNDAELLQRTKQKSLVDFL